MRAVSATTLGILSVAMTLATAAAAGLHAPTGVWIATLATAVVLMVVAGLQHRHEGGVSTDAAAAHTDPPSTFNPPGSPPHSFPSLADELEHLRGEGITVLEEVGPTSGGGTPGAEKRDRQARPDVLAEDKQKVARWTRETGHVVERKLPEFTLFFYGDDDQPIPLEPDTTREQLASCMDARLTSLDQIIRAVRRGHVSRHRHRESS